MGFRENLKSELKYQDLKVKDLADKAGVPKRTIDHYLTENSYTPSAENAVKIARALGVTVEYLVCGSDALSDTTKKTKAKKIVKALTRLDETDLRSVEALVHAMEKRYQN